MRSVTDKVDELAVILRNNNIQVCCLTESWGKEENPDEMYRIPGFELFRNDRKGRVGGGVMVHILDNIPYKRWHELENECFETLWITIWPKKLPKICSPLTFGFVYHPEHRPQSKYHYEIAQHIRQSVDSIMTKHPHTGIILTGDFNKFPDRLITSCIPSLKQLVTFPTREKATLDKVYANIPFYSKDSMFPLPKVGSSDHFSVLGKPTIPSTYSAGSKFTVQRRQMDNNHKAMFVHGLQAVDWTPLYHATNTVDKFEFFNDTMTSLINEHFPVITSQRHTSDKPWVTDHFRALIKERQLALAHDNKVRYNMLRNLVNRLSKSLKSTFYKGKVAELKQEQPQKWWTNIKALTGQNNQSQNPLAALANNVTDGNLDHLTSKINDFFCSVSSVLDPLPPDNEYFEFSVDHLPSEFIISIQEVEKQLLKTNTRKASGPDHIPNWIIKDMAAILAPPVCAIFNSSIQNGIVPSLWKSAEVIPLPKVTPPKVIEQDLRPISLTPILAKLLEDYPVKWLWKVLDGKIDPCQFGCLKNTSTTHALVQLLDHLYKETDGAVNYARVLLLDYRKAFDLIDHSILLGKLKTLGVPPFLLKWISSFLSSRFQRVKVGNSMSDWGTLNGGVPQGTKLGPVLFLCMINDLQLDIPTIKYVDDTSATKCSNDRSDNSMQQAADSAAAWSEANNMQLNAKKTKELVVDFSQANSELPPVVIQGEVIERVPHGKLLGLHISSDLKWHYHVTQIVKTASKKLYLIAQLKRAKVPPEDILTILVSIIRPKLEYACPAWHTSLTEEDHDLIESVQKRCLKMVFPSMSYDEALKAANIPTLKERRYDICVKLFEDMQNENHRLFHLLPAEHDRGGHNTRLRLSHSSKYQVPKWKTKRYKNSFVPWCLYNLQDTY